MFFKIAFLSIFNVYLTSAALFLWSTHELNISSLQEFSTKEFADIVQKLKIPDVFVFQSPNYLSGNIKSAMKGFYSIYSPNGVLEYDNIIELTGNSEEDYNIIEQNVQNSTNFISVIIIPNYELTRSKRQLDTTDTNTDQTTKDIPTGPVIYKTVNVIKNDIYALLYSSKPLLFKKDDSEIYLGNVADDMIIYDTRLNINIPRSSRGKITLRFSFSWQNGYWYMPSVKITDTQSNGDYNLSAVENIFAPKSFSYHCNGETVFRDNSGVELRLYDLQVQIDSKNGKFGDVNDCVPFITVPIWSGLFISFILGIGLVIALTAIMDIKTMDKFDNYKTKNLVITASD
ncbi:V-type proton ATPase subunit S1-like [Diorhabda carinulata]|uniref:V-type proton ATPase subunit S1-like n=1 Tax=Diorhabda carinulata TaxID=1163345 RepID=UPI0025A20D5C|nr:V-type proton ATPase subunit S1-like [Diorhabda carinulata]